MQDKEMPFLAHFVELRRRLILSTVFLILGTLIGLIFYNDYVSVLVQPFGEKLYILQIEQGFTAKVKISLYVGIIVSFPVHLYNGVAFVLPALTRGERNALIYFLLGSFILFAIGSYLAYFQILPLSIRFLKSSSFFPTDVSIWLDYKQSLTFVFQLLFSFLALFQLPLVLLILMKFNIIGRNWLFQSARYVIILIFVVCAILTPPDIMSQLGLAVPLVLLFFLTILVAKLFKFGE